MRGVYASTPTTSTTTSSSSTLGRRAQQQKMVLASSRATKPITSMHFPRWGPGGARAVSEQRGGGTAQRVGPSGP
eukprot:3122035-Pyramimonas_sp.AAC.1